MRLYFAIVTQIPHWPGSRKILAAALAYLMLFLAVPRSYGQAAGGVIQGTAQGTASVAGVTVNTPIAGATITVCSIATALTESESGTTVTVTTSSPHGFVQGSQISFYGSSVSGYNGTFSVASAPTANSLTYTALSSGLAAATGGQIASASTPCAPLATVYTDETLTVTRANPTTADSNGNYTLYAPPGFYTLQISGAGLGTYTNTVQVAPGTGSNVNFSGTIGAKILEGTYSADQYCATPGTKDHTCIQNAINAASAAGGGTVFIATGTYTATASIALASNVSLVCSEGWSSQINFVDDGTASMRKFIGGTPAQTGTGVSNVAIVGCSIAMTGVSGRTGVYGVVSFYNSTHISLLRNQFGAVLGTNTHNGSSSTCTYIDNTSFFEEASNTCDGTQADGFHVTRGSNNGSIHDNFFKFTGDDSIGMVAIITDDGVHTYAPVLQMAVFANHIGQNGGTGIGNGQSPNSGGITCIGCARSVMSGNTIDTPAGPCVAVNAVIGNVNGNSTRYPFFDVMTDNTCNNSGAIGTTNAAFVMEFTRASRMHHNVVNVHSSDGIFVGAVNVDVIVDDNWVSGVQGRDINAIAASSTEARLILELWTNFGFGSPARVGISNLILHHNNLSSPTLAAIEIDGETALHQTGAVVSENIIYNTPANQPGILGIKIDSSLFLKNNCQNLNNQVCTNLSTGDSDTVDGGMAMTGTGASSGGCIFLSMTNSVVMNLFVRSAGIGVFMDAGGSNNVAKNNDLRANSVGGLLIQDATSRARDNDGSTLNQMTGPLSIPEQAFNGSAAFVVIGGDAADHFFKYNANNAGEQHVPQNIVLTAQYTNSTTGFTNVAGGVTIQWTVKASTTYTAECHLYYQAAATGGLNIEFTGPSAPTSVVYGLTEPSTATTFNSSVATAFGTSLGTAAGTATTNFDAEVSFSLINGANAGTVNLLAKSSAAAQLQIQAGSFCQIQ